MDCFGERETRSYLASIVSSEADEDRQPAVPEGTQRIGRDRLSEESGVRFVQQRQPHAHDSQDLHRSGHCRDVHRGAAAGQGGAEHHGRTSRRLPRWSVRVESRSSSGRRRHSSSAPIRSPSIASSSRSWNRNVARSVRRRSSIATRRISEISSRASMKNRFYREPGHIKTASELGLGKWELTEIERKKIDVSSKLVEAARTLRTSCTSRVRPRPSAISRRKQCDHELGNPPRDQRSPRRHDGCSQQTAGRIDLEGGAAGVHPVESRPSRRRGLRDVS